MADEETGNRGVLYLIACGSPRTAKLGELIELAQARGWTVCVVATPSGRRFMDVTAVEVQTGYPVRSDYKQPGTPDVLPPADAILVCPATFNTMNKWALGISDTLALGLVTEAVGLGLPLVAAPSLNSAQAKHPAFGRSVDALRAMRVTVLYGAGVYEPTDPGTGGRAYDFNVALDALDPKNDGAA